MPKNDLLIAIPSAGRPEPLANLLALLDKQTRFDFTVVCLNDGANPDTEKILKTPFKFTLKSFASPEKSGLPGARNKILQYIRARKLAEAPDTFVAFLDDDIIPENDFIEQIHRYKKDWDGFCFRIIQKGASSTIDLVDRPMAQKVFSVLIGTCNLTLGLVFGGYYIPGGKIHKTKHLNGGCLIYNFSKNSDLNFDMALNQGNFVMEDTCFSYELHRRGNKLAYISSYAYIHQPALEGGCRIDHREDRFYWYWKHKFYIVGKFGNAFQKITSKGLAFPESLIFSFMTRKNQIPHYLKALQCP